MTNTSPFIPTPLPTAVAPVRAKHHQLLAELGKWALARGEPIDLDVAAAVAGAADDDLLGKDGPFERATRPGINQLVTCGVFNWCTFNGCLAPDGFPTAVWQLLHFLRDSGRLHPESDPFERLLEPLHCYAGLGPDGRPAPEGYRPDFPCECFLDVAPPSKAGLSRFRLACGSLVEMWRPRASEPKLLEWYRALGAFSRAIRNERMSRIVHLEDWDVVGRIPPGPGWGELWVYCHHRTHGELIVDQYGAPYGTCPDRRRKLGFRFETISLYPAAWRAGLPGTESLAWPAEDDEMTGDDTWSDASEADDASVIPIARSRWPWD